MSKGKIVKTGNAELGRTIRKIRLRKFKLNDSKFYDLRIDKIKNLSLEEKILRKKNLDLFYQNGFPNKKNEDWKFTDLKSNYFNKNFNNYCKKDL